MKGSARSGIREARMGVVIRRADGTIREDLGTVTVYPNTPRGVLRRARQWLTRARSNIRTRLSWHR